MSKKRVDAAIEAAERGDWATVDGTLAEVETGFLRRRLRNLASMGTQSRGVRALQLRRFPNDVAPAPIPVSPNLPNGGPASPTPPERLPVTTVEIPSPQRVRLPPEFVLDQPRQLLALLSRNILIEGNLDEVHFAQVWGLVALGAMARRQGSNCSRLIYSTANAASRFAIALQLSNLIEGTPPRHPGEKGRTVTLRRVSSFPMIEPLAHEIARLIIEDGPRPEADGPAETRKVLSYVIVELLRNVLQHSRDPLGGVIAAQLMNEQQGYPEPKIQVAVADCGLGIYETLRSMHPRIDEPRSALENALRPHISGTFEEGGTGSTQNAGLGLFFISEMAKLTAGRLLVASRGAALVLKGDQDGGPDHSIEFIEPSDIGYPGTLVAFEMPVCEVRDFNALIETVQSNARRYIPRRNHNKLLRFASEPPEGVMQFRIDVVAENTANAQAYSQRVLIPFLLERRPLCLDFGTFSICTQSFLHALLSECVRLAWALSIPVYVVNAKPAVRSALEYLEEYSLSG